MANHPLTGAYLPADSTDPPAGGTQVSQAVSQLSPFTVPRFTSTGARDAAYNAWVAQGGVMKKNMLCGTDSPDALWKYTGSAWKQLVVDVSDTGWQNLSPASGWTSFTGKYRVLAGWCEFSLLCTASGTRPAGAVLTTLPAAAQPSSSAPALYFASIFNDTPREVNVLVNGNVQVNKSTPSGAGIAVTGKFPVG